jgi:hypothetical protein
MAILKAALKKSLKRMTPAEIKEVIKLASQTSKNIGKGIVRATKKSKGRKPKGRNTTQATLSQGTTGKVIIGSGATGVIAGANLPKKPKRRKKAIDSKTNVASRMKATERGIGPQLGDKKRKVKKTKSKVTSPPVPKRKPTPSKQKKTTNRIPKTEVFVDENVTIDFGQLPKDENKVIKRKKGNQVLRDLKDRDPKKPITPQERKDIDQLKKNLQKDKQKPLTPKQKKLDVNKDGKLEASDFEELRNKKVVSAMTGGQIVSMMYDD